MKHTISLLSLLVLTVACGGGGGGGGSSRQEQTSPVSEATSFGKYRAFLRPLNTRTNGFITSGKAEIAVDTNLSVNLIMDDAPGVVHMQGIHLGHSCPDLAADKNNDGYVDIIEAESYVGKVIIPLDDQLEKQIEGRRTYPAGRSYTYNRKADLSTLIDDLTNEDGAISGNVIKLPNGSGLNLEGKVVVIHGTYEAVKLPDTVKTMDGLTKAWTIPIACGKLQKVE